jgi:predicted alpha/beta-hydrolase family hydrolase
LKNCSELKVAWGTGATTALVYSSGTPGSAVLILGHGAGAGQHSAFMTDAARGLAGHGLDIVTFNFLYTEQGRRIPDRKLVLMLCYRAVIETIRARVGLERHLFIGGKSMGGRIATEVAAADPGLSIAGLVLLGYPLHPPGRPDQMREGHLPSIARPMLFVQGSRDAFGLPTEIAAVAQRLSPPPTCHVVAGGDHSFKIAKRNPAAQAAVDEDVRRVIVAWVRRLTAADAR